MAPKRSAPPPPPPPAASSEETDSSSGSEETEEEEIAHSPPRSVVSKNPPPPPPPPPQKGEESETSDEEEEEEEGESEDSDKAPPPKPAANEEAKAGKDPKTTTSNDGKKLFFQRTWSTEDEVRILEALGAHRRKHGVLPQIDALFALLAGCLDNRGCSRRELQRKISTLKRKYDATAKKRELPAKDHDLRLFNLSKSVWGIDDAAAPLDGSARREFGEMARLYPFLAEEVKQLDAAHPGLFKRDFGKIDGDRARGLDAKIKKQRLDQMTLELRGGDLAKEVIKALMELIQ